MSASGALSLSLPRPLPPSAWETESQLHAEQTPTIFSESLKAQFVSGVEKVEWNFEIVKIVLFECTEAAF